MTDARPEARRRPFVTAMVVLSLGFATPMTLVALAQGLLGQINHGQEVDLISVALLMGLPTLLIGAVVGASWTPLLLLMLLRTERVAPDLGPIFEESFRGPIWRSWIEPYREVIRLFLGWSVVSPAAWAHGLLLTALSIAALDAQTEGVLTATMALWRTFPWRTELATSSVNTLSNALEDGSHMASVFAWGASILIAALAIITLLGLIRLGREPGGRARSLVTFAYVAADLAWFVLLYRAASAVDLARSAVAETATPVALTIWQSGFLALGTLTTAGAPGITPLNDVARVLMAAQLATLAVLAFWLIGPAEAFGALGRERSLDDYE